MKLSTRGRYGARALLDLAVHYDRSPIPLRDIARRQGISVQYLEHLVPPLIKAGILRGIRGAGGGIALSKPPEQIKLSQVIEILEGSTTPVECVDNPAVCPRSDSCVTRDIWAEVNKAMGCVLESITLEDLVKRHEEKEKAKTPLYHI